MYRDLSLIRKHRVNLSFNDAEDSLIEAYCNITGDEKAVFIRELALERAKEILGIGHSSQSAYGSHEMRDARQSRYAA